MTIAIIPARLSSKRIKKKNIKKFFGLPIISYVIKTAIGSKLFKEVIVSTESKKIKKIAEKYGAKVPFLRSKKLSNDHTSTREVIIDVIKKLEMKNYEFENICCIYPTSIFINKKNLINANKVFLKNKKKYIFSACKYSHPIQRSFSLNKNNKPIPFLKKNLKKRTQDFKVTYHDAGQFYFGSKKSFLNGVNIFSKKAYPIILKSQYVLDIDNLEDWKLAEIKFKILKKIKK